MATSAEKFQLLLTYGTGHKHFNDDLFKTVDDTLKIYRREGVFEIEEQLDDEPE